MKKKQYLVYHPSQLNSLSTLPWAHRSGIGKIVLADSFQHDRKDQFESALNKSYYACGCDQGAKALILGLLLFAIAGGAGHVNAAWPWSQTISTILGGSILMALTGKLIGLMAANRRLKQTVREIQTDWKPKWPESKISGCG